MVVILADAVAVVRYGGREGVRVERLLVMRWWLGHVVIV